MFYYFVALLFTSVSITEIELARDILEGVKDTRLKLEAIFPSRHYFRSQYK